MMGENDEVGLYARVDLIARPARSSLHPERTVVIHLHPLDLKRDIQPAAQVLAELRPVGRVWADSMVNVDRAKREPHHSREIRQDREQRDGIDSARKTDHEVRPGMHDGLQRRSHPVDKAT